MSTKSLDEMTRAALEPAVSETLKQPVVNLSTVVSYVLPEDMPLQHLDKLVYTLPTMSCTAAEIELVGMPALEIIESFNRDVIQSFSSLVSVALINKSGTDFFYEGSTITFDLEVTTDLVFISPIDHYTYDDTITLDTISIRTSLEHVSRFTFEYSAGIDLAPLDIQTSMQVDYSLISDVDISLPIILDNPVLSTHRTSSVDIPELTIDATLVFRRGIEHYTYDIPIDITLDINTEVDFICYDDIYMVYTIEPVVVEFDIELEASVVEFDIEVDTIVVERRPY